ncbi:hypothetical protein C6W10_18395 [Plantactinospora sp. BB1]|nr:hypothetical protein C6W10_18395 [Plantactinospora sp. BB1]
MAGAAGYLFARLSSCPVCAPASALAGALTVRADEDTVRDVRHRFDQREHARLRSEKGLRWGGMTFPEAA